MKKEDKILTYSEAYELKWFCRNVMGVRQEMYKVMATLDSVLEFNDRLARLEKTCVLIEKFLGEKIEPFDKINWEERSADGEPITPAKEMG